MDVLQDGVTRRLACYISCCQSMSAPGGTIVSDVVAVHPRRPLVLAACMMATFTAAVEITIVATAMPTIVADLHGAQLYSWVFSVYLLTLEETIPIYGRLADLHGRKRVFIAGSF